jgi:ABC-type transporter Mla subunit MlaD
MSVGTGRAHNAQEDELLAEIQQTIHLVGAGSDDLAGGAQRAADLAVDTRQLAHDGSDLLTGVLGDLETAVKTVEMCLDQLHSWVTSTREAQTTGPDRATLSSIPTLDWQLLELPETC